MWEGSAHGGHMLCYLWACDPKLHEKASRVSQKALFYHVCFSFSHQGPADFPQWWAQSVMWNKLSLPKMVFYHNRNSKSPLISKYSWKSKIYQHKQFKVIKDTQYIHERSSLFLKNKIYQFVIKTNTCSLEARSHSVVLQSHSDDLASVFQVLRHGPEPIAQQLSPWSFFKATFLFFKATFLSNHDKLLQVLN